MNKFYKSKTDGSIFKNIFVRMDVHKNYLQVAVLDEKGKVLNNSRVDNTLMKSSFFRTTLKSFNIKYEHNNLFMEAEQNFDTLRKITENFFTLLLIEVG